MTFGKPIYSFRLRFHLREADRVGIDRAAVEILTKEGTTWTLKSGESETPIRAHSQVSIVAKDFPSEATARAAGQECRDAMLAWAVSQRRGIDLGDDSARVIATAEYLARVASQLGVPARNDLHGLDVFASAPETAFVRIDADASSLKDGPVFINELAGLLASPPKISEKVSLAAELFTLSCLDGAPRSRFIMLTSAIEVLLEPKQHDTIVQEFVNETKLRLDTLPIPKETRDSLNGTLRWLRQESIGRAGQRLGTEVLRSQTYAGQAPDVFFRDCYRLRSQLVHEGTSGLGAQKLRERCDWLAVFVGDLLNQEIFGEINRQPVICGFEQYEDGSVRWRMLE
jgi:hypothetical protein